MFQFVQSAIRQGCEANFSFVATSIKLHILHENKTVFHELISHITIEKLLLRSISSKQNIKDGAQTGNRTPIPALKKIVNKQSKTQRHKDEQTDKHK